MTPSRAEKKLARDDYGRLITGERLKMSISRYLILIDVCGSRDRMDELASCLNRDRCGFEDSYVAWVGKEHRPDDLVWGGGGSFYAEGSVTGKVREGSDSDE